MAFLEAAKGSAALRTVKAETCVLDALQVAREGLGEARRSVRTMQPLPPDGVDLTEALRRLTGRLDAGGPATTVQVSGLPRALATQVEENLYRVTKEALANSLRRARTSVIA